MKKSLGSYCLFLISALLCLAGLFSCTAEASGVKSVLLDDDFSVKNAYTAFSGTYTDNVGIGNSAPAVYLETGQRLTYQVQACLSGVYVVAFDFMKPDNSNQGIFWELTDATGSKAAATISCDGTNLFLNCFDNNSEDQSVALGGITPNTWYRISVTVDLDNKGLVVYIDGKRIASDKNLYYNPEIEAIGRFFDSRCYRSNYYIDNLYIYKDLLAEENATKAEILKDDFSVALPYTAFTGVYTEEEGIGNPAPAVHLDKGQRLTKQLSALSSGVYVVEFDFMKVDKGGAGIFWEMTDARGSNDAAYLYSDGSAIYMRCYDNEGNFCTVLLEDDFSYGKWYRISVSVDVDTKNLRVWIDGRRVTKDKILYFNPNIDSIGRLFDCRAYSSDFYIDNLNIYEDVLAEEINIADIFNPVSDIVLSNMGKSGKGTITWKSSYTSAISNAGKIRIRPDYDTSVTFTGTYTNGTVTETREYIVRLKGLLSSVISVGNVVDQFYYTVDYQLPTVVSAVLANGNKTMLPVRWENSYDVHLHDVPQVIYGEVANGTCSVKATITVLGAFNIQRVCIADKTGKSVVRFIEGGNISDIVIRKNVPGFLDGNIVVTIFDEYGEIVNSKEIELSSITEWNTNGFTVIPTGVELGDSNPDGYYIKVCAENPVGEPYCNTYTYNPGKYARTTADIVIAGDSVISSRGRKNNSNSGNIKGWGETLKHFFDDEVSVTDFSASKSKITALYDYKTILNAISEGDYIILSFGNTDTTYRITDYPDGDSFKEALTAFLNSVYSRNAHPILLMPISTKYSYADLHEEYKDAIMSVASDYKVPLIDINEKLENRFKELNYDIYWANNGHYLTMDGAIQVAKLVVEEIDAVETYIDDLILSDVVIGAENPENFENASYRVNKLRFYDSVGNEVVKISEASKIGFVTAELRIKQAISGTLYVAVYSGDKLEFVNCYDIPLDENWEEYRLKDIPVDIDISKYTGDNVKVKVMMFANNALPYSNAYTLNK